MHVLDNNGRPLDATVKLEGDADIQQITFESRGPGRNVDYIKGFDLILSRLATLGASIVDATVVSRVTRHLPIQARRLVVDGRPYPIRLTPADKNGSVARSLRAAAAAVGRRRTAEGGGNPTKRMEVRFQVPERHLRSPLWLARHLVGQSTSLESPANSASSDVGHKVLTTKTRVQSGAAASSAYRRKLPAMRHWLISVANNEGLVTYGDMMEKFDVDRFTLHHALRALGNQARDKGEPILTALVVQAITRRCSGGMRKEFGVRDDRVERQRLYDFWRSRRQVPSSADSQDGAPLIGGPPGLAQIERRPEQSAFRRRIFNACGGACVVSGCTVAAALDAAHLIGRGWRLGYNREQDGVVLRKDLHALYDGGLLTISPDGKVDVHSSIIRDYGNFRGVRLSRLVVRTLSLAKVRRRRRP